MKIQEYFCEECKIESRVQYSYGAGVMEVIYLIKDDHKKWSPNCFCPINKLRLIRYEKHLQTENDQLRKEKEIGIRLARHILSLPSTELDGKGYEIAHELLKNTEQGEYVMKTFCPECGVNVQVDEDGLCMGCGAVAIGAGVDRLAEEIKKWKHTSGFSKVDEKDQLRKAVNFVYEWLNKVIEPDEYRTYCCCPICHQTWHTGGLFRRENHLRGCWVPEFKIIAANSRK